MDNSPAQPEAFATVGGGGEIDINHAVISPQSEERCEATVAGVIAGGRGETDIDVLDWKKTR
jgi:hypothetical protein